jgi:protein TonB
MKMTVEPPRRQREAGEVGLEERPASRPSQAGIPVVRPPQAYRDADGDSYVVDRSLPAKDGEAGSNEPEPKRSRVPVKRRGADLRGAYRLTLEIGLVVALLILIALMHLPLYPGDDFEIPMVEQEVVQMEEIQQTKQIERPPPPPRPPTPVVVADDVILDDEVLDLDASLDINEAVSELPPPPPPPAPSQEEAVEEEEEIFVVVEDMPVLIGGIESLYKVLEYPDIARQAGVDGRVIVQFVVDEQGNVTRPEVIRSAGDVLDRAALKAVVQLKFKPGKQRGKAVRVRYAIPVRFELR